MTQHTGSAELHGAHDHARHESAHAKGAHDHGSMIADYRRRFRVSLALTVPVLALSPGLWELFGLAPPIRFSGDRYALFAGASAVYFYGGWPFLRGSIQELGRRQPGMMLLIGVAITSAYVYSSAVTFGFPGMGFYWELATLIDIMLLGHWIEMRSVMGASGALEALVRLLPAEAHRLTANGASEDVPVAEIKPGDRVLVKPGERVPTDGVIVSGQTSLDESMLTGESRPIEKGEGAEVIGGGVDFAITRAVTVMVISCPHALGLAVPLVVAVSTSLSASHGLLIRDRAAFEHARNLQAVVFDKTGTLTEGRFGVSDVVPLADLPEDQCLRIAAALESQSEHPIARGVMRAARERSLDLPAVSDFKNLTGRGAQARVEGRDIKVVSPGYLRSERLEVNDARLDKLGGQGKTLVYLVVDGKPAAAIALADVVRPESRAAIARLKEMGIQCMMLTGDSRAVANTVAAELGLDDAFAEVLPEQKADKIKEVQGRGLTVAMVGDGVNDAPALTQSDLGIAIGAGTDVAMESADIVLVRSDPRDVAAILGLARATYGKMVQNLLWATGYNAVAIPLAAGVAVSWGVLLTPAVGAVLMSASTVIVAINAKLLGRTRGDRGEHT